MGEASHLFFRVCGLPFGWNFSFPSPGKGAIGLERCSIWLLFAWWLFRSFFEIRSLVSQVNFNSVCRGEWPWMRMILLPLPSECLSYRCYPLCPVLCSYGAWPYAAVHSRQAHSNSTSWTTSLTPWVFFFFLNSNFSPWLYHRRQLLAHHPIWKLKLRLFILFSIRLMWKGVNNGWSSHLTPGAVVYSCIVRRSFCFSFVLREERKYWSLLSASSVALLLYVLLLFHRLG